jgi:hypothetical protein
MVEQCVALAAEGFQCIRLGPLPPVDGGIYPIVAS